MNSFVLCLFGVLLIATVTTSAIAGASANTTLTAAWC